MLNLPRTFSFFIAIIFLVQNTALSQNSINALNIWEEMNTPVQLTETENLPLKYQTRTLDFKSLKAALNQGFIAENDTKVILEIPFPNGEMNTFEIRRTNVMHPDLAAKFPEILTFSGFDLENKNQSVTLTLTPSGLRATVVSGKERIRIRPAEKENNSLHISYFIKDLNQNDFEPWECEAMKEVKEMVEKENKNMSESAGDCQLRTYRLALACTGGYAQKFGGTKSEVMDEFVSTVSNLNAFLQREVGVFLELVPDNDDLIFLNASTDGYTEGDRGAMINENQTKCNNVIGAANYDIGHLFSVTGGGLAGVGVVCGGSKARAVSGLNNPTGYYFETIVLHEMGHQFSAGHTQNNDCNRSSFSAMETGSGSTIMSYAGVCAPNVQFPSDDYYHSISLQQIQSFTTAGLGSNCPDIEDLGNIAPDVNAGDDHFLPTNTYFELEGTATNPDGDDQVYIWEQMDNEMTDAPPVANSDEGPAFRSFYPNDSKVRTFPNIDAIVMGTTPEWEVLPAVEREMNFRFNVRDRYDGIGCAIEDDLHLTFWDPPGGNDFRVIDPETVVTWFVGDVIPIQWTPANTFDAPVDCERVDIYLSTDGGYTYPILLAENVLNEPGEYEIMVPNAVGTQNRIKVKCANNVFFDISNTDFAIEEPPVPTFLMTASPLSQEICGEELSETTYGLNLTQIAGFDETVSFAADGAPDGATVSFEPETIVPGGTVTVTISDLNEDTEQGDFLITINASSLSQSRDVQFDFQYFFGAPDETKLMSPDNGANISGVSEMLSWIPNPHAREYTVEVATNPAFGASIVHSGMTQNTNYNVSGLDFETVYYWRVRGENICGIGSNSMIYAFQTPAVVCDLYNTENVNIEIPGSGSGSSIDASSILNVGDSRSILDVNVLNFNVEHNYLGDISASLISPAGTPVQLFHRPGVPASTFGCNGRNIVATFDNDAPMTQADLESMCSLTPPAVTGDFQPLESLSGFNNSDAQGDWELLITDFYPAADGGQILNWSLEICSGGGSVPSPDLTKNPLSLLKGTSETVSNANLAASKTDVNAEDLIYTLVSLPQSGTLFLNGTELNAGDQFTQQDIDNQLFSYTHDDSDSVSDGFYFDILDNESGWLGAQFLDIEIVSQPVAQTVLISDIDCHNNNNGSIEAEVAGGTAPFEYSLDGMTFQNESLFENLAEGTYTITVRDANGFEHVSNEITITNPAPLNASASTNIYDITINATGGTGTYLYSSNGTDFQNENTFIFTQAGSFTFIIQDENGCQTTTEATTSFSAQANISNEVSCFDGNDGAIEITVSGGPMPYEYSISGGSYQSENIFDGLQAGDYSITVKDAFGNEISANSVTLDNPEELTVSASSNDFEITANANGGTGDLEYSLDGLIFQNDNNFTVLVNGIYTVTVRDENGCTATSEIEISVNTLVVSANLIQQITCFDFNDGSISATVSGGTPPFQYSLNGVDFQNENTFENLTPGTYKITISDSEGFTRETNEITIENPEELTLSTGSIDFEITANANGGTGNFEYSLDGTNFQSANNFTAPANGIYTVTVRDENDCTTTSEIEISVNTLVVSANLIQQITCFDFNDGSISATVSGGTPPFQYSLNGVDFQNENTFENLAPGTYKITILDAEGFTRETNEITIENPEELTISASSNDFEITANANGGTGVLEYSLDGMTWFDTNIINVFSNGIYTVYVRDENGCVSTTEIEISVNTLVVGAILESDIICHDYFDAVISATASGGTPPYQYSLNGTNFQDSNLFIGVGPGTYSVTVLDSEGFTMETNEITVINPDPITATATVDGYDIIVNADGGWGGFQYKLQGLPGVQTDPTFPCVEPGIYTVIVIDEKDCLFEIPDVEVDGSPDLIETSFGLPTCHNVSDGWVGLSVVGGVPPFEFSLDGVNYQSSSLFENLGSGDYTIYMKDACGHVFMTILTLQGPAEITNEVTVTGPFISSNTDGGTPGYQYSLDGINYQDDPDFGPLPTGVQTLYILDANNCELTEDFEITYQILTLENVLVATPNCNDETVLAEFCFNGGEAPYTWVINPGSAVVNQVNGNCDLNLEVEIGDGTFELVVTDVHGISVSNAFNIAIPLPLELDLEIDANNVTVNPTGGTPPYTYSLNGNPEPDNIFNDLPNGDYTIEVTDANGCTVTEEVNITKTVERFADLGFEIMPNPTDGILFLKSENHLRNNLNIRILNPIGQLIFETDWTQNEGLEKRLDLDWISAGTYQVFLTDGEFLAIEKVVILK